jgi:nitroreductase/NAD-dependent dihydropyrimidine dehydrogenase PreA subunit
MRRTPMPPEIDSTECTGCGICVQACPVFTLDMRDGKAVVDRGEWCIECGHCGAVCPVDAVVQKKTVVAPDLTVGEKAAVSPEVLMQLLRERRSVRSYLKEPISKEVLEQIINAGRYAPTGSNSQRVHYLIMTSPDEISELGKEIMEFNAKFFKQLEKKPFAVLMSMFMGRKKIQELLNYGPAILHAQKRIEKGEDPLLRHAQALLLVHAEDWDGSPAFNCAAAIYHCSLMAHVLGVGVCFNGWVENSVNNNKKLKNRLGIPKDNKCYGAMTMGYQDIKYRRLIERNLPDVQWR